MKKGFYPFAEERGFYREKQTNPLFVTFRRTVGSEEQVFEIQWDKYHKPYFVINIGKGNLEANPTTNMGRLQRGSRGSVRKWFGLRRPWLSKLTSGRWRYSPEEVVTELISAFEELERWWRDGSEGPHLELWGRGEE